MTYFVVGTVVAVVSCLVTDIAVKVSSDNNK